MAGLPFGHHARAAAHRALRPAASHTSRWLARPPLGAEGVLGSARRWLPQFHTSANQQIERSESKAARGRARRATNEVGDALQKSASSDQDKLTKAGDMLQGQRVVASFCAQGARKLRPLRSASRSTLNGLAMISSSRLAELQHATSLEVLRRAKPRAFQFRVRQHSLAPKKMVFEFQGEQKQRITLLYKGGSTLSLLR